METTQDTALAPLQERIRIAAANRSPLRFQGGGSKDFYGQTLQGELLDTRASPALSGVVSYEPSELVVTVRSGTPLATVEALLANRGQYLPFEPPHYPWSGSSRKATVGGMVAAGLSGPARASVGSVRDHVLGVTLLNGRAELLRFGGQVIKNVAGYDVSRVMVGAMGTLGLLVDVSLKVLPVPLADATLVFEMSQAEALAHLHRWGGQPLPLNASCWVKCHAPTLVASQTALPPMGASPTSGRPVGERDEPDRELLFLRLRGAVAAVEAACAKLQHEVPAAARATRMDNAQAEPDWALCRDHQLPFFTTPPAPAPGLALWRLSVPQTAPALDLPWPQLVEWHGAQRWLWAPLSAATSLRAAAAQVGGSAIIFAVNNGVNIENSCQFNVFPPLPSPLDRIHRQLKAEFDPAGIFNPGRLYDGL